MPSALAVSYGFINSKAFGITIIVVYLVASVPQAIRDLVKKWGSFFFTHDDKYLYLEFKFEPHVYGLVVLCKKEVILFCGMSALRRVY